MKKVDELLNDANIVHRVFGKSSDGATTTLVFKGERQFKSAKEVLKSVK